MVRVSKIIHPQMEIITIQPYTKDRQQLLWGWRLHFKEENIEDTKGVIRVRKSMMDRQYNSWHKGKTILSGVPEG